ncbi:MAG: transposase, partial [Acidobacteriota bacterium]
LSYLEELGATPMTKVKPPSAPGGHFTKDRFAIDLDAATVTCPSDLTVPIRPLNDGGGYASFGVVCDGCSLRDACTTAKAGRVITISPYEKLLVTAREAQSDPDWQADYKANRPKVERKLAHLLRRRHGGRRARMRGKKRINQDWKLLAAATNLARLATLGLRQSNGGWAVAAI